MKVGPQTWDDFEKEPVSVMEACISLDGTRIAAVFADKTLCVYDAITGEAILPPFEVDKNPRSVIFSRDGKLVATGGNALRLWNVQTGEEVESFDIDVHSLALSPDGTCIAVGCKGRDIDVEDSVGRGSYNIRVINLELARATYFHTHIFIPSGGEGIKLLKGEVPPSPFEGHKADVFSVAYSPDGKQIASSSKDGVVRVWDVSTGESRTFDPSYSDMDEWASYSDMEGWASYSDVEEWSHPIAFSPDGSKLVSDARLFNLSTASCLSDAFWPITKSIDITLLERTWSIYLAIAFSADGRFLASGSYGGDCRIWDTTTYQIIANLVGHTGNVCSIDFFPDGKQIMSASEDGTIRVWDVDSALLEEGPWKEIGEWQIDSDMNWSGCIFGLEGEAIFFSPLPFRHARNTLVIGKCMTIDFSNFVHGDNWVKCRKPLKSKFEETRGSARDGG